MFEEPEPVGNIVEIKLEYILALENIFSDIFYRQVKSVLFRDMRVEG
jgi:hypothetical protein